MPFRIGRAIGYAVLLWGLGFVWGSIVFMTPALKARPIPYVSSNRMISFPILIVWSVLTYVLAKDYLKRADRQIAQGLKLGLIFSLTNAFLDLVVLVILLKAGWGYFVSLTVWLAYAILLFVPWATGRSFHASRVE